MDGIHVFIISWKGQHDRAAHIAQSLSDRLNKISIVYSDPDEVDFSTLTCQLIRRDNALFWSDKFTACLDYCNPDDIMLVIHADCSCEDWGQLLAKCRDAYDRIDDIAIWSPKLRGTPWRLERTRLRRIDGSDCIMVAQTDGLVFSLSPAITQRMRDADYSQNILGHGIDWLFICAAYARDQIAVVDESILVRHPLSRGYSTHEARAQKIAFLEQHLTTEELAAHVRLRRLMLPRKHYGKLLYWLECLKSWWAHLTTSGSKQSDGLC